MMTPRIMAALSCALIVTVPAVSATAASKAPLGPKHGSFTCEGAIAGELSFLKGNKYVFADGERAKFVHQTGRDRVRFKTGDLAAYAGSYDRATDVVSLVLVADGSAAGSCARTVVEEPAGDDEIRAID